MLSESAMNKLIELRMQAKQLERLSAKSEKESKKMKKKVQKAMQDGNREIARIHAESAIMKHNESVKFLKLSAQIDAVHSRLKSVAVTSQISKQMEQVTGTLIKAAKQLDVEKVELTMSKFTEAFDNLEVTTGVMDMSLDTVSTPQSTAVDSLLDDIEAEMRMESMEKMGASNINLQNNEIISNNANNVSNPAKRTVIDLDGL
eukprot:TRINITY_DN2461_c0_g1_i1.p1 TRINITY_DN2461_c0_g1~~TRINITY_DN2461_c0_g1_i1.p1  ORF type:complete len:203 (-),score=77.37 TRINITY_DN2461_c0_g1_i1:27-635(-)